MWNLKYDTNESIYETETESWTQKISWSEPQSTPGLVLLTVQSYSIFGCKEYNQSDFSIDHVQHPCVGSSLVLLEEGVCCDQSVLLAKPYQPLPCFILYSNAFARYFLTSYFCILAPYNENNIFFGCQVIANTLFQQHKRGLYTWTSPNGQYQNQIDCIPCSQRWRSSIQSAKTTPGADCGSDHAFLIAKFRLKLKNVWKTLDHSGMTQIIRSLRIIQWKSEIDSRDYI